MKKTLLLFVMSVSLFLASCTKQPIACFSADKTNVEIGETIAFTSCAKDAEKVEWSFGDGETATTSEATHAYTAPGTYLVTLKVFSKKDKKVDNFSVVITVKGYTRYLTKAVLKSFTATKPDNSTWDNAGVITNPEPDVFLRFRIANVSGWEYTTSTKGDIKPADLPFTWNLTQQNIYLSNANWNIDLRDDDSFNTNFSSENMTSFTLNPATSGTNGVISLTNADGYSIDLYFENRQ